MRALGEHRHTIWPHPTKAGVVEVIDQRYLPHRFVTEEIATLEQMITAIKEMHVRGAPLIGVCGAYGLAIAAHEIRKNEQGFFRSLADAAAQLKASRPTAVNLAWAVDLLHSRAGERRSVSDTVSELWQGANEILRFELDRSRQIGRHGVDIIAKIAARHPERPVNILTHCNAGWLACVDYGTATAPIYEAHKRGIKLHVWVDETRPRNQGAALTAWELLQEEIPHTVIADNAGGHLMQHGLVDVVIVGADRVTRAGDAANKIGTYLKALAAKDCGVPLYVAIPSSTLDFSLFDGVAEIPIEQRSPDEVRYVDGLANGGITRVLVTPENSPARNDAFDVTPARLITALITERGICPANETKIMKLFSDANAASSPISTCTK